MNWLTIFFIIAFLLYLQMYFYMSKREHDLKERLKQVHDLAMEHRYRYNDMSKDEYWKGRRDEAGWFADLLLDAIYLEGAWKKGARK